ncbi:RING-type E3 ubiquitin transferase [Salvia divinorum]|uniref:RING-type E3 ubiquitin transferase n=1 Tax=Salvia divinorum TaxID=28513 RepID=A0ABD1HBC5_SALDI
MGSGISRTCSGSHSREVPRKVPRPTMRRSISSVLICGASSSSTTEMEDYPAELLVNSAEHGCRKKLKVPRRNSDLSEGNGNDLISVKSESVVSSRRIFGAYDNSILEVGSSIDDPSDRGKWLSESRELVPSHQPIDTSRCDGTASSSYGGQPSPIFLSGNELSSINHINGINCNMKGDASQIGQGFDNTSRVYCDVLRESFLGEVPVENNVTEEIDYSSSNFGSSFVSDSPLDFHFSRGNIPRIWIFCRAARRNSRRLFWDAFSRRGFRRHADSRTYLFSSAGSDHLRSPDRQILDFSGGFIDDEFVGDLGSHGSRSPGSNDQHLMPRLELWDRLGGNLDSTYYPPPACPRGVHADGSCLCQSSSLAEESGPRSGISRIVMLAEALFEVLDQIHQQPLSLSLSVTSHPAPESVVDSFLVKTHGKSENLECADDVSQCYICLAEYEEGDKIRVLPCHHEYHASCVDKWLKEIHGVCPLCRGDVSLLSTEV